MFPRLVPRWRPHPGQRAFLTHPARYRVLACGRRWGKTDAAAASLVVELTEKSPARQLILAPTLDQAGRLFERVADMAHGAGLRFERPTRVPYPTLRVGPHIVTARSGLVPRHLRGDEATHIVVDEAAFLPESLIHDVALPMLATTNGRLTLISTPNGRNYFWRFFRMGERGEAGFWSRAGPSAESPRVSAEFLELQRRLVSDRTFRVEYLAEFVDSAGTVFPAEAVEACLVADLGSAGPAVVAGVDWGRYDDYTAIAVMAGDTEGATLLHVERFHGAGWPELVARTASALARFPVVPVVCDATGIGDAATDLLRLALPDHPVQRFVFTGASKSGLVDTLATLIDRRVLRMTPHPELLRELEHYTAQVGPTGRARFSAPDGLHDDLVTALALAAHGLPSPYRARILLG